MLNDVQISFLIGMCFGGFFVWLGKYVGYRVKLKNKENIFKQVLKETEMSRKPTYEKETDEYMLHIFEREFEKSIKNAIDLSI